MRANFKLRKGIKINTILLDLRFGREIRVRYSTNLTIKKGSEKYWDKSKCRIKIPNDILDYELINNELRQYENEIENSINNLTINGKLSQKNLEQAVRDVFNINKTEVNQNGKNSNLILKYFDWYIEFYSKNNSPFTNSNLNAGTLKTYKNCKNYLENYMKSKKIKKLVFEDMNEDFYYAFIEYGHKNGYSKNYIGSMIQKLKTIIRSAYENKVHNNNEYSKKYFSKMTEEINHPYLNEDELNQILKLKLTDSLEKDVRDIFLIDSNTGLRIGDLSDFLKNPVVKIIKNKKFIHLNQKKTGGEVCIPLNNTILEILNKRNGKFPPFIHPNLINKHIKSIARKAKINDEFTIEKTSGGKKISETKPKHRFITAHTARRSFCTNAYNSGIPPHQIMTISGHKSEKVFYNYIKATVQEKAIQVAEHSFFN